MLLSLVAQLQQQQLAKIWGCTHTCHVVEQTKMMEVFAWQRAGVRVEK